MATTLYLTQDWTPPGQDCYQSETTTLRPDGPGTGSFVLRSLKAKTTANTSIATIPVGTTTGPKTAPGIPIADFWSDYLSGSGTISGTISFDIWGNESSMSANATFTVVIWLQRTDGTNSVIVNSSYGTEISTSNSQYSWSAAPTSTSYNTGDRLYIAVYADDATATTMGNSYTVYFSFNAPEGSTGDTQIRFTETLSFTSAPTGTTAYLLNASSDISGSQKLKLWTDAKGTSISKTVNTNAATNSPNQWTDSAGGTVVEWFTPQLEAVTLSGQCDIVLVGNMSSLSANVTPVIKIYKTDSDGSNPVQIAVAARHYNQLSFGSESILSFSTGINATLTNGQRIMVRLYTGTALYSAAWESAGYTASLSIEYNTRTSIKFPATLTEYIPSPATSAGDYWGAAA